MSLLTLELTKYYMIQLTVGKIIVLSILTFATSWAAKNYSAHRHNFVINTHRHNALSTFETFVSAANDDISTKNAVLLHATQTIFQHQPTGYSKNESSATDQSKVLEITRTFSSTIK